MRDSPSYNPKFNIILWQIHILDKCLWMSEGNKLPSKTIESNKFLSASKINYKNIKNLRRKAL